MRGVPPFCLCSKCERIHRLLCIVVVVVYTHRHVRPQTKGGFKMAMTFDYSDYISRDEARDLGTILIDTMLDIYEDMTAPDTARAEMLAASIENLKGARAALVKWQEELNARLAK